MEAYKLVTGVAGFIGSKVAEILLEKGERVIGIDNLNDYYSVDLKKKRLEKLANNDGFKFFQIDIENLISIQKIFRDFEFDCVYNLAARAGVRYSMENPFIYLSTNALGSLNILECMEKADCKNYVLASTSSLYAGQKMPFVESLEVNQPISPYAATKKSAEVMAYTYHHLYNFNVSIVRYFTVFGPASRPDMAILRFIKWIEEGKEIKLYGDGSQSRDFTFVDDIALGTIRSGERSKGFEIYNLGGGKNPISVNQIISELERLLGKKAKIKNLEFNKADMLHTWADISKAERDLDWTPLTDWKTGLSLTVSEFKENLQFYTDLQLP